MIQSNLKERMQNGETVYGLFINSVSSIAVEVAGLSGYDFVLIDSEHGPSDVLDNRELIMAAEYRGTVPFVRIPNKLQSSVLKTLDVGAHGILVPQVNSKKEAEDIANSARYCPEGMRGVASARSSDYGFVKDYFKKANDRTMVAVQCENIIGVPYLDEIAAIPGIDIIFIGPFDLSQSMNAIGQVSYESIKEVVHAVLSAVHNHNKQAGIFVRNAQEAKFYSDLGFHFIIVGTDISMFANACRSAQAELHQ